MKFTSILVALIAIQTLIACTPPNSESSSADSPRPMYLGDLDKKISEIYSKENETYFDPCDFINRSRIIELAKVLEQKNFLNSNWLFNKFNKDLDEDNVSKTEKRELLNIYLKRIQRESSYFTFRINPQARVEGNTLVIPMDLSVLGETTTRFTELIEATHLNTILEI